MARHDLSAVVRYLQQLAGTSGASGASDADLLERYVRCRDEAAFELLLWRHGALVLNVCRRLLPCPQDAEDAFQATFLAFVRKAGSISRRGSVASWLYKVAYRVALEARERARKTGAMEKHIGEIMAVQPAAEPLWSDVQPILDEELNRLPERLRRPIVLCYLEGKSNEEAARQLGCPAGTIFSRLARGREMLRRRLQRRGVTLTAAVLTAALAEHAAEAMPAALMATTLRNALLLAAGKTARGVSASAAALAEGVLRTMFVIKLKLMALTVLVVGIAAGGVLTYGRTAAPQAEAKAEDPPPKPAGGDKKNAEPIAVKVVKPKKGRLPMTFFGSTFAEPAQRQQLVSLISGTISEVAVGVGDSVIKGQVLIRLAAPLLAQDVEEAEATLELAQAQVDEAKAKVAAVEKRVRSALAEHSELVQAMAFWNAAKAKQFAILRLFPDTARPWSSRSARISQDSGVAYDRLPMWRKPDMPVARVLRLTQKHPADANAEVSGRADGIGVAR